MLQSLKSNQKVTKNHKEHEKQQPISNRKYYGIIITTNDGLPLFHFS